MSNTLTDVTINGYIFKGFSDFTTVNSKTYVVEPERSDDGSIPDINNSVVFYVPRVKISFKYMRIEDYQRLMLAIEPNEFVVSYFDYQKGQQVRHKMYIEPQELEKIHTYRLEVLGILDKTISLIGTRNGIDTFALSYNANGGIGTIAGQSFVMGEIFKLSDGASFSKANYTLKEWNTLANGEGLSINLGSYKVGEESNLTLYAIWEENLTYTISFDYNGQTMPEEANEENWVTTKTVTYNTSIGTLPAPEITGYTFDGWYVFLEYDPSKYEDNDTYLVKGSITLKAKWTEVE